MVWHLSQWAVSKFIQEELGGAVTASPTAKLFISVIIAVTGPVVGNQPVLYELHVSQKMISDDYLGVPVS